MNKTIKKIAALGIGASMLLGTAAVALAYDLSNYPSPFIKDSVFVGKIVIGEAASTIDTIGALDIAASLQRAASTTVSSTGSATQVEGGVRLDSSSDRIYYGEYPGVDSVTKDGLSILADGQFEDDAGTVYDYTQSIVFDKTASSFNKLVFSQHGESEVDSTLGFDLDTTVGASNYYYVTKVDFTKVLNASDADSIGNKITLFGKEFTFSSESTSTELVLYGSAEEVSLTPADDVTKTINGKDYAVKVIGFSSTGTKVTIQVNGATDSITEGNSKTIGGLKIYAKSVSSWNNGIDGFATLQLGADKVLLKQGNKVKLGQGEDAVDGTYVDFGSGSPGALTKIWIYTNAADSDLDFVKEGGSFVDPIYGSFKVQYTGNNFGLTDSARDVVTISESGSDKVYAKVPTTGGSDVSVYFNYQGALQWDSNYKIHAIEGASSLENHYIYLAPNDPKYTHLVKVSDINLDATEGYVELTDALTGSKYESKKGTLITTNDALTLTADGKDYTVTLKDNSTSAPKIAVTYPDSKTVVYPEIELKGGETFFLTAGLTLATEGITTLNATTTTLVFPGYQGGTGAVLTNGTTVSTTAGVTPTNSEITYDLTVATGNFTAITPSATAAPAFWLKEERDYTSSYEVIRVNTTYLTSSHDKIATPAFTGANSGFVSMADDYTTAAVDYYGTYVTRYNPSGDDNVVVKIYYPPEQMYANVFVSPLAAKATSTSTSGAVSLNPISVGMAITDTEATLGGSTPYIVVGGPCANTVAATLMNNPADCAAGFTEGKAMIKLYADKNALLVAGFSGKDTQGASRVLSTYKDWGFSGTELEVVTASLTDLKVNKISN